MRRLAFLVASAASAAVVVAGAGPAYADNDLSPHVKTSSTGTATTWGSVTRCAGCHRAHQAQGAMLLTKSTEQALCDTCHNGSGASTNVEQGVSVAGAGGALRGGGFTKARIKSDSPTAIYYYNTSRSSYSLLEGQIPAATSSTTTTSNHLLGATAAYGLGLSGGATGTLQTSEGIAPLECGSCHDPHGNGNYRILKPVPSGVVNSAMSVTSIVVASNVATVTTSVQHYLGVGNTVTIAGVGAPFDGTFSVYQTPTYTTFTIQVTAADGTVTPTGTPTAKNAGQVIQDVPSGTSRVYTTADYWKVNDETTPTTTVGTTANVSSFIGGIAAWCTQCHTRYQTGPSGTYANASNDAVYTYRHRGNSVRANDYKFGTGASAAHITNQVNTPNCIQCHVAHGTNAAAVGTVYGVDVTYPGSTTVETSSLLRIDNRGICQMCHNK